MEPCSRFVVLSVGLLLLGSVRCGASVPAALPARAAQGASAAQASADTSTKPGLVKAPVIVYESPFRVTHEEASRASRGATEVRIVVDTAGIPHDVSVVRSCGDSDLDQRAVASVAQYRFKPGTKDGKLVRVELYISVNFR